MLWGKMDIVDVGEIASGSQHAAALHGSRPRLAVPRASWVFAPVRQYD